MPGVGRQPALRLRGTDLMEGQDEVVGPDVPLILAERPDPDILIAVIGDVDDEARRFRAHIGI